MAGRSVDFGQLRHEIELFVAAERARNGDGRLNKEAVARRFADRGASRASICRWIQALLSGSRSRPDVAAAGAPPQPASGSLPCSQLGSFLQAPRPATGASAPGISIAVSPPRAACLTAADPELNQQRDLARCLAAMVAAVEQESRPCAQRIVERLSDQLNGTEVEAVASHSGLLSDAIALMTPPTCGSCYAFSSGYCSLRHIPAAAIDDDCPCYERADQAANLP